MNDKQNKVGFGAQAVSWLQSHNFLGGLHGPSIQQDAIKSQLIKLEKITRSFTKKSIGTWRSAWQFAISATNPQRSQLYDQYQDALIDNHLTGALEIRTLKLLKRKFKIVDRKTGEVDEEKTDLLNRAWFDQFLSFSQGSKYWGHSLIEFGDLTDGEFKGVQLVNRYHVKPERGFIVRHQTDDVGVSFREEPFSNWVIEVGGQFDLGLLLKATPQAIAKKQMFAFWEEFAEIFGIPIRIAKTPTRDKKERSDIEAMMDQMGSAAWGLFPDGTDIEIKETSSRDAYKVFDERISRANSEMSKLILGQTMLMDDGSSQSQAEVHEQVANDVMDADAREIWNLVNNKLFPFLIMHGYPLEGFRFTWDDTTELSFDEQLQADIFLTSQFEIDEQYYIDKYKVPITGPKLNTTSMQEIQAVLQGLKKK